MVTIRRSFLLLYSSVSSAVIASRVVIWLATLAILLGQPVVIRAVCPPGGCVCVSPTAVPCVDGCCADGSTCNPLPAPTGSCCTTDHPVPCHNGGFGGCCDPGQTCNELASNQPGPFCCTEANPVPCSSGGCCPADSHCSQDGLHCLSCPPTDPQDCGNGFCCPANGQCMPGGTCGCPTDAPVQCSHVCCPTGSACNTDGTGCMAVCSAPTTTDCHDGTCCPAGDVCGSAPLNGGDVLYPACCISLPPPGCCHHAAIVDSAAATAITREAKVDAHASSASCGRTIRARPFDVIQIGSASAGTTFDLSSHAYAIAFALGGKNSAHGVVLKVPVILDDSNTGSLSVMVPPFLLKPQARGRADLFLLTDGAMSDRCVGRVNIAALPRSASKVPGLITASWVRANQGAYSSARAALDQVAQSSPHLVHPTVAPDVASAITNAGTLITTFINVRTGGKPLVKAAKQSDVLITALLTAATKVGDSTFSSACSGWLGAIRKAKNTDDAALQAGEAAYVNAVFNASGGTAPLVAKFIVACQSVTTAGAATAATLIAGGSRTSGRIDAQSMAATICGATCGATAVVCGVTSVTARARIPGAPAYGKSLLTGSSLTSASTSINYGGLNLPTAKVCGCPQPSLQGVITISITIITICDHIRTMAPTFCLPEGPPSSQTGGTPPCGDGTIGSGEECDPAANPNGCTAGKTCEACRCVGTGDVRVTLVWDTVDDLDLHVTDPAGTEIYYGNRSADGGMLDVDSNAGCGSTTMHPVENVFWATGTAPHGTYTVRVDYYKHCTGGSTTVPFTVKTLVDGAGSSFSGSVNTPDTCGLCSSCNTCTAVTTFTR